MSWRGRPPEWLHFLYKVICSVFLGGCAVTWGVPYSLALRGGFTMGGEWLVILLAFAAPFVFSPDLWKK